MIQELKHKCVKLVGVEYTLAVKYMYDLAW